MSESDYARIPMRNPARYIDTPLIDDEVRAIYEAQGPMTTFFTYEPLLAQLIIELRKMREAMTISTRSSAG